MSEVHTGLPDWVRPLAAKDTGFPCPKCGERMPIGNSRREGGSVRRRRYCACGHRVSTREIPVNFLATRQDLQALLIQAEQTVSAATYMAMAIREAIAALPPES